MKTRFFFDREGLEAVVSPTVVGEGLRYFKEQRVIDVDQDQVRLWAQVEDEALETPCLVELVATVHILLSCESIKVALGWGLGRLGWKQQD